MQDLIIKSTVCTPEVSFTPQTNEYWIKGESRPEDVAQFYSPVLDWLEKFEAHCKILSNTLEHGARSVFKFEFALVYFNSESAQYLMRFMKIMRAINKISAKITVRVCWFYDDQNERIKDAGEEFEELSGIPFEFCEMD